MLCRICAEFAIFWRRILTSLFITAVHCYRTWNEVWDVSSKECRDEITQIDSDSLLVTVEEYLRKHR